MTRLAISAGHAADYDIPGDALLDRLASASGLGGNDGNSKTAGLKHNIGGSLEGRCEEKDIQQRQSGFSIFDHTGMYESIRRFRSARAAFRAASCNGPSPKTTKWLPGRCLAISAAASTQSKGLFSS